MGMVCDAEGMIVAPVGAGATTSTGAVSSTNVAGPDRPSGAISASPADGGATSHAAICGCESCHAPPSALSIVATVASPMPFVSALEPVEPLSIVRAPLVPPPQVVV